MIRPCAGFLVLTLAFGFFRGWITASTVAAADGNSGVLLSWDSARIRDDLIEATNRIHALAEAAIRKAHEAVVPGEPERESELGAAPVLPAGAAVGAANRENLDRP